MLLIPALDLRKGKCVRLYQGIPEKETVFSGDPVAVAKKWEEEGAPWLHVVDLDGAFTGSPQNLATVREIVKNLKIPVQLGGGLRTQEAVETAFASGVARVILGTTAALNPFLLERLLTLYGEKIAVGLDVKDGKIAIEGWQKTLSQPLFTFTNQLKAAGVTRVIYTDTKRDGTLKGLNLAGIKAFVSYAGLKVIASGGIASLQEIQALQSLVSQDIEGVILGRALYTGKIRFAEAQALLLRQG